MAGDDRTICLAAMRVITDARFSIMIVTTINKSASGSVTKW